MTDLADPVRAQATALFGSETAAGDWLNRPAIGLDQRRPVELLETAEGVREVQDLLTRIEHGVHT
jgi:putative toxin-antitoxin system antitoxin component (TIGR02293 family)